MTKQLQDLVYQLTALSMLFKHAHWNVRGVMFQPVHKQLDDVYATLQESIDTLAERMVMLDEPADGNPEAVASNAGLAGLPVRFVSPAQVVKDLSKRLGTVVKNCTQAVNDSGEDLITQDILIGVTQALDKHFWMLRVQTDNPDGDADDDDDDEKEASAAPAPASDPARNAVQQFLSKFNAK